MSDANYGLIRIKQRPPRLVIYSDGGVGKTTLASQFPSPIFLCCEDPDTNSETNIAAFVMDKNNTDPVFRDFESFIEAVDFLVARPSPQFKTIVIDSLSGLDKLIEDYMMKTAFPNERERKTKTFADSVSYGRAYDKAAEIHRDLRAKLDTFKEKDIAVIYLGHEIKEKVKPADGDDYDYITIKINHPKSRAIYLNDIDAVFYYKQPYYTTKNSNKRTIVISSKERIILTHQSAAYSSKNRWNMIPEINIPDGANGFEILSQHIPYYKNLKEKEIAAAALPQKSEPVLEKETE